ncbi:hypothetical protein ACYSNU_18805 [Enterococcus sp. LJL120]
MKRVGLNILFSVFLFGCSYRFMLLPVQSFFSGPFPWLILFTFGAILIIFILPFISVACPFLKGENLYSIGGACILCCLLWLLFFNLNPPTVVGTSEANTGGRLVAVYEIYATNLAGLAIIFSLGTKLIRSYLKS